MHFVTLQAKLAQNYWPFTVINVINNWITFFFLIIPAYKIPKLLKINNYFVNIFLTLKLYTKIRVYGLDNKYITSD